MNCSAVGHEFNVNESTIYIKQHIYIYIYLRCNVPKTVMYWFYDEGYDQWLAGA